MKILKYLINKAKRANKKTRIHLIRIKLLLLFIKNGSGIKKQKSVFIDIGGGLAIERDLINFSHYFHMENYDVNLKISKNLIAQFSKYYEIIAKIGVRLVIRRTNSNIILSDRPNPDGIQLLKYPSKQSYFYRESFIWPYSMHPEVYGQNKHQYNGKERSQKCRFKLVFAGNLSSLHYKDIKLGNTTYINRVKLTSILDKEFKKEIFVPKTKEEFFSIENKSICIIDRSNFSLTIDEYFTLFQESEFALCPPGVSIPFCHNLIEAMHNSCIPVLQYADLLNPNLVHSKNSIQFNDEYEFVSIIKKILIMNENRVFSMKNEVQEYYNSHLWPASVIKNFENAIKSGISTVYIPSEIVD